MPLQQPIHRAIPQIQQQRQMPTQVPIQQVVCCFVFSVESNVFIFLFSLLASSSGTGQADYTQQWIEYYRSLGQNDLADQIAQQTKEVGDFLLFFIRNKLFVI